MTETEAADFKRLCADPTFKLFAYRLIVSCGLFSAPSERHEFLEGRRSVALELLGEIDTALGNPSADGLPLMASIQILLAASQSAPKEKHLGRRSDLYRDSDGDDD